MKRIAYFFILSNLLLFSSLSAQVLELDGTSSGGGELSGGSYQALISIGESMPLELDQGNNGKLGLLQPQLFNLLNFALTDSVWPGDTDLDGTINNLDLLPIGVGFGKMGPPRPNATMLLQPQMALPWVLTYPVGINYKHLDTDGNSLIEADDTLAIQANYGITYKRGGNYKSGYPLSVEILGTNLAVGDTLRGNVQLGADTLPVPDAYGVGFSLEFDTTLVRFESFKVDYDSSWLGTIGTDALSLSHPNPALGSVDIAMVRTDHTSLAGYGQVCSFTIIMIDDLAGKKDSSLLNMRLSRVRAINQSGEEQPIRIQEDSVFITQTSTFLPEAAGPKIEVFPNPAQETVFLHSPYQNSSLRMTDLQGRLVHQQSLLPGPNEISVQDLAQGTYFLEVRSEGASQVLSLRVE